MFSRLRRNQGATLIELLVALIIISLAAISSLGFFSYGLGGMGTQGSRRAALEQARERLEQLMQTSVLSIKPPDTTIRWLTCAGSPCVWALSGAQPDPLELVLVDDFSRPIESTVQLVNDPTNDTDGTVPSPDALELGVKVWFTPDTGTDDDLNRVFIKTLRTP